MNRRSNSNDLDSSTTSSECNEDSKFDNFDNEDVESLGNTIDMSIQKELKADDLLSSPCIHGSRTVSLDVDNNNKRRGSLKQILINIDARSHLEVADAKHRYSKNLRL